MRRFLKRFNNSIIGKILRAILKMLWLGIEIWIIFLAIIIVVPRVTNNEKTFMGFRIFNVATGSMEPEYAVGDILISREKDPSEIEVGENIVYLGKSGGYEGKIITHSVIQIEQEENGDYLFHTKGKANTVEDPIVEEDQLYGVIVQNNVVLAWFCKILTNRYGLYFFVVIPIILNAFIGFVRVQEQKVEEEREQRRLEAERRKQHKKRKPRPVEVVEEVLEEEVLEGETPKKVKTKGTKAKKDKEEILEEETEAPKKSKTKGTVSKAKKEENVEKSNQKTKTTSKSSKTEKEEKIVETAKKTTKKKQAKEE